MLWVAALAVPLLGERLSAGNVAAVGLLLAGQVVALGGVGHLAGGSGSLLVLSATLLWAVEVVVAKRLLGGLSPATVAVARMGIGTAVLLAYLGATGALGQLADLELGQAGWVLVTGLLLAGYVATWTTALSRGRAVDVTSVLVASALVTVALQVAAGGGVPAPHAVGLVLVAGGTGLVLWSRPRSAPA